MKLENFFHFEYPDYYLYTPTFHLIFLLQVFHLGTYLELNPLFNPQR